MQAGLAEAAARYGLLIDPQNAFVNGFHYQSRSPIEGATNLAEGNANAGDSEYQRRVSRAEETFENRRWRSEMERWDSEWKPQIRATNRELRDVTPGDLDDEGLIQHLEAARQANSDHNVLSFRIVLAYVILLGDFLAHAREWTDRSAADLVGLMEGSSPLSAGAVEELEAVTTALQSDQDAEELLFLDEDPATILDDLRTGDDGVGTAVEEWLDVVGYRVVSGFGLSDQYALERPETLVNTLRGALNEDDDGRPGPNQSEALDAIRGDIPSSKRETFDDLLQEARSAYRIRDDRALVTSTTQGLLRRALMEAGRRLAERGQLRDPEHVVDLRHEEVVAALRGRPAPTASEVAAHARYRQNHDTSDAPDRLGPAQPDSVPLDQLPEAATRLMRAMTAYGWANAEGSETSDSTTIRGLGVGQGTFQGPAKLVTGSDDFGDIQDGDIVVAEVTTPAFNVILPMVGAVVTDTGGMLSHPAIVAREFGIPGVVGCEDATDRIQDGDQLIVDGGEGTVQFVS
jgi:pyruvate,water dikinase